MKTIIENSGIARVTGLLLLAWMMANHTFAQRDEEGCKDHPLFTRMPGFYISACEEEDFNSVEFMDENGEAYSVEGKRYWTEYYLKDGAKAPSDLQTIRNYQNAIKRIGGIVVFESIGDNYGDTYLKLQRAGETVWVIVNSLDKERYELTIVEKKEMVQEVVADAKKLINDILSMGHASVYGIYFDFEQATVKPGSEQAIKEVAKLLNENRNLKLYVVGHTDNTGTIEHNMELSLERAKAVVEELTTVYSVSPDRLSAYGVGPLAPVSSNETNEGRALNRRVELVKQ